MLVKAPEAQRDKRFFASFFSKKEALTSLRIGDVAQLVEHLLCKQGVVGSIPSISTRFGFVLFMGKFEFRYSGLRIPAKVA